MQPDPITTLRDRHRTSVSFYSFHHLPPDFTLDHAAQLLAELRPDGSWPDINYADTSLSTWSPAQHLFRLANIALTHLRANGDSPPHPAVFRALDFWYAQNLQCPNWWWNQIGAPGALADALICLPVDCPRSYIDRAIPSFEAHTRGGLDFTGQNLVWVASIQIRQGILTRDEKRISQAISRIANQVRIFPAEEGIQPDMSFHQHGKLLYSGGYGQNFAKDVAALISLTIDTPFAFPEHVTDLFIRFILDGSRWMVRGNTFDPAAVGREITRQGLNADRFHLALKHLAQNPIHHKRFVEILAAAEIKPSQNTSLVSGNRHFWSSDFLTHHRPDFYISVRMTSNRILRCDGPHGGGEGRTLHHMADGVTHLFRDGNEYRDIYPVLNYRQLPGITAVQHTGDFDPKTLVTKGETSFVGAASDGSYGCAAMDFSRDGLTARKAWFLLDNGLVALAAGITSRHNTPVHTTLNQCLWRTPVTISSLTRMVSPADAPVNHLLPQNHFFTHDGFTYTILQGQATLRLGPQSGAWSDCGVGSREHVSLPVLKAYFDHGTNPSNSGCAYAILTDQNLPVILCNSPTLQAVWLPGESRAFAVFYEPGALTLPNRQTLQVDQPCILLYHAPAPQTVVLTYASPDQHEGNLVISLASLIQARLVLPFATGDQAGSSRSVSLEFGH